MDRKKEDVNGFAKAHVLRFSESVSYANGGVVSKVVMKTEHGNVSLFSFEKGEGLSEHSAPFDALVQIIEGEAGIFINGQKYNLTAGESIIMPANVPHAVQAPERFKMILTMIK